MNKTTLACLMLVLWLPVAHAEIVFDEVDGAIPGEAITPLADGELDDLVGPVALYPDDLLAIMLPASTYPLQVVQAARFLDDLEANPSLTPSEGWAEPVVALLNYPEALRLMDEDLNWTWQLGNAVLSQQSDVIAAIERFRGRAHTAGHLETDDKQIVEVVDDAIEIRPADPEVIYVPYYEPARVVVYHHTPAYFYYPKAYPVYYYPYPYGYGFRSRHFWGVSTAYRIGWHDRYLRSHPPTYYHHPYFGRRYHSHHYYHKPRYASRTHHTNHRWAGTSHQRGARPETKQGTTRRHAPRRQTAATQNGKRAWREHVNPSIQNRDAHARLRTKSNAPPKPVRAKPRPAPRTAKPLVRREPAQTYQARRSAPTQSANPRNGRAVVMHTPSRARPSTAPARSARPSVARTSKASAPRSARPLRTPTRPATASARPNAQTRATTRPSKRTNARAQNRASARASTGGARGGFSSGQFGSARFSTR